MDVDVQLILSTEQDKVLSEGFKEDFLHFSIILFFNDERRIFGTGNGDISAFKLSKSIPSKNGWAFRENISNSDPSGPQPSLFLESFCRSLWHKSCAS